MQEVRGSTPRSSTQRSSRFSGDLIHVWVWRSGAPHRAAGVRARFVFAWLLVAFLAWFAAGCRCLRAVVVAGDARVPGSAAGLGRPCGGELVEGLAAPPPGFRGQAFCGAALVFLLPGVPGREDALVAGDEQRDGEQHQRCRAHEAAPAAAGVVAGGVLGGGEAAFGAGAAGVGAGGGGWGGGGVFAGLCVGWGRGGGGV